MTVPGLPPGSCHGFRDESTTTASHKRARSRELLRPRGACSPRPSTAQPNVSSPVIPTLNPAPPMAMPH